MPNKRKGLQAVPVIVVGSHYDQIHDRQQEVVMSVQSLVNEMKIKYVTYFVPIYHYFYHYILYRFEDYLDISPHLYPLNCLKAVTPEIKALKDHLCEVRSKLLEVKSATNH